MNLQNKTALITGGAKRIGRALALALAEAGCHIIIHYGRSAEAAQATAEEIRAFGVKAWMLQADLGNEAEVEKLIPSAIALAGQVDILINNASIFEQEKFPQASSACWDKTMMINLKTPFLLSQAFAQALPDAGPGKIINLLDTDSQQPRNHHFAYTLSKVGLEAMTKMMAEALAPRNIQVNGLALGFILPDVNDQDPSRFEKMGKRTPAQRTGSPEDVAQAMRYLLQNADYVTGEVIRVDGGKHLL